MDLTTRREFLKDAALAGAAITTSTLGEGNLLAAAQARRARRPPPHRKGSRSPGSEQRLWSPAASVGECPGRRGRLLAARLQSERVGQGPAPAELAAGLLAGRFHQMEWICHGRACGLAGSITLATGSSAAPGALKVTNDGKSVSSIPARCNVLFQPPAA